MKRKLEHAERTIKKTRENGKQRPALRHITRQLRNGAKPTMCSAVGTAGETRSSTYIGRAGAREWSIGNLQSRVAPYRQARAVMVCCRHDEWTPQSVFQLTPHERPLSERCPSGVVYLRQCYYYHRQRCHPSTSERDEKKLIQR